MSKYFSSLRTHHFWCYIGKQLSSCVREKDHSPWLSLYRQQTWTQRLHLQRVVQETSWCRWPWCRPARSILHHPSRGQSSSIFLQWSEIGQRHLLSCRGSKQGLTPALNPYRLWWHHPCLNKCQHICNNVLYVQNKSIQNYSLKH